MEAGLGSQNVPLSLKTYTALLLPPPVVGLLGHPDLFAHLNHGLSLGQSHLRLTQLDEDLLGRKSLPCHPLPPS